MLWAQQRKQLLARFINTQQSFLVFLFPGGVAGRAVALLCGAVFLQDARKGEGILCLCPSVVTLGREIGKRAGVRKSSAVTTQ